MPLQSEPVAHKGLVDARETDLHSHAGGGAIDLKPAVFVDTSGNQAIGSEATVNLNSTPLSNAIYSLASNEVTIDSAGKYFLTYSICYDITNTSGGTRGSVDGHLEKNSVDITGSWSKVYHREEGGSGLSGQTYVSASVGDKIRLRMQRVEGNTNIDTVANKVTLSIAKVA